METLLADIAAHRVDVAAATLDTAIDVGRDPKGMDVCLVAALDQGHVVALYKLTRNGLKWFKWGAVPCSTELTSAFVHALVLLLRVAQDVQACVTDLGRPDRAWVYHSFLNKVGAWVAAWPPASAPPIHEVADKVRAWTTGLVTWPNPAWAASFQAPIVGVTFKFVRPRPEDVAAFDRCRTLDATRADVASRLHEALLSSSNWDIVFTSALSSVVMV